jgi:hypothetical protein
MTETRDNNPRRALYLTDAELAEIRVRVFDKVAEICHGGTKFSRIAESASEVTEWVVTGKHPRWGDE